MVTSTINGVNLWYLQGLIIKLLLLCIDSKVLHLNTRGAAGRHGSFNASGFCHFVAVWSLIHMVRRDVWSWVVGVVPADVECWSDMDCSKSVLFRWWQQSMNVVAVVVVVVAASQFWDLHEDDSAPVSPAHSPSLFPGSSLISEVSSSSSSPGWSTVQSQGGGGGGGRSSGGGGSHWEGVGWLIIHISWSGDHWLSCCCTLN